MIIVIPDGHLPMLGNQYASAYWSSEPRLFFPSGKNPVTLFFITTYWAIPAHPV